MNSAPVPQAVMERLKRLIILPEDVPKLLGERCSTMRGVQDHLRRIRKALGKERWQHVTIFEFADYEGFEAEHVIQILKLEKTTR